MLMPERSSSGSILTCRNQINTRDIPVNRFQLLSRLGQTYLTDMISRSIDHQLHWQKRNQEYIFGGDMRGEETNTTEDREEDVDVDGTSSTTFLSQSLHGSRRHLQRLGKNALTIVSEKGSPHLFITVTCNPRWNEITEMLLPGQCAFDRPDIVDRVFKNRLSALLHNIKAGKYFDDFDAYGRTVVRREIVYMMYSIEYQHRGMPHAHIVIRLDNFSDIAQYKVKLVDRFLSARKPVISATSSMQDIAYEDIVGRHMKHKCNNAVNGCLDKNGRCTKGFQDHSIREHTAIREDGRITYRRDNEADLMIGPHCPTMLCDWDGHAYCDVCNVETVIYLYKYLFKGSKKTKFKLNNAEDIPDGDEIALHIRGRYLCSMDAMWRTLGYQTYPSPQPSVLTIKVMSPTASAFFQTKGKSNRLLQYFSRPSELFHLKYTEFHAAYIVNKKMTDSLRSSRAHCLCTIDGVGQLYCYERDRCNARNENIVRMEYLWPNAGENYYLRLILFNKACMSYEDARTYEGVVYATFQECAIKMRLIEDEKEARSCFNEAARWSTPPELRLLFVTMTLEGFPTLSFLQQVHRDRFFNALTLDYRMDAATPSNRASLMNKLLSDFVLLFREHGKQLSDYGLPEPEIVETELQRHAMKYPPEEQRIEFERLQDQQPNNAEQDTTFRRIISSINNGETAKYFINGKGGAGKSTLAKKLVAYTRMQSLVAAGCASVGLAATNFEGFETAHSFFCYPVVEEEERDESEPPVCQLWKKEGRAELLSSVKLIIWDEFLSNNRELYEAAHRATSGFEGIVLVCMGDFKQIMPVVKFANREMQIDACITRSKYWPLFTVCTLVTNMRLQNRIETMTRNTLGLSTTDPAYLEEMEEINGQRQYGDMIVNIGQGKRSIHGAGYERVSYERDEQMYQLNLIETYLENQDEGLALQFLFPDGFTTNACKGATILAATNKTVEKWNDAVQRLNANPMKTLQSKDKFGDVDDPHNHIANAMSETVLNKFQAAGIPPRDLKLKVGDVCIVLRNLSMRDGLQNNARVRILDIKPYCIRVQTLEDSPRTATVPRIRFKFKLPFAFSYTVSRLQFPLRLAYSMTYNKSQGQTLSKVLLDVTTPPFAHGHLYVALSRIQFFRDIRLICNEDQLDDTGNPIVTNIVYPELLHE